MAHERASDVLAVVGRGRVGSAIARACAEAGREATLAGRDDAVAVAQTAGAALLCVPDGAIRDACEAITAAVPPLRFVGHTSGATGLEALDRAAGRGAELFSLHPLQTITGAAEAPLTGAPCAIAGSSPDALAFARSLAEDLGMRPFEVPEEGRTAYHAAASVASNFLVALEEAAVELLDRAGVEDGRELIAPLVLRTAANWSEDGGAALTGPIARGDEETVEAHIDAIEELHPELLGLYAALAERARKVAAGNAKARA